MSEAIAERDELLEELERAEEANRGWRAMMLAKDLETYRALMRGESVPLDRLDAKWVARFGLKR